MTPDEGSILADLKTIMEGLTDWEYGGRVTPDTLFFADLGFESIDAVVFGEAIEAHYQRRFPYARFLAEIGELGQSDIRLGDIVDFLHLHLQSAHGAQGGSL